jgi:Mg2+ and Co2+ transporter CorA
MNTYRAQQVWEAFKGELIDNGLKDSEDVRQGLSSAIREVADRLCTDVGEMECFIEVVRQIADEIDEIEELVNRRAESRKSLDAIISLEDDNCDYFDDYGETTRE